MYLYIYIEGSEFEEIADEFAATTASWIEETESRAVLVNQTDTEQDGAVPFAVSDWDLGVNISIVKGKHLKKPLQFLNDQAKKFKLDFVIGIYDEEAGSTEDICYFGHEEGKPDLFEVSSYLGVKL